MNEILNMHVEEESSKRCKNISLASDDVLFWNIKIVPFSTRLCLLGLGKYNYQRFCASLNAIADHQMSRHQVAEGVKLQEFRLL